MQHARLSPSDREELNEILERIYDDFNQLNAKLNEVLDKNTLDEKAFSEVLEVSDEFSKTFGDFTENRRELKSKLLGISK